MVIWRQIYQGQPQGAVEDDALHFTRSPHMPGRLFPWTAMHTSHAGSDSSESRDKNNQRVSDLKVASQNVIVITKLLSSSL
jgi:hypothetical protein